MSEATCDKCGRPIVFRTTNGRVHPVHVQGGNAKGKAKK